MSHKKEYGECIYCGKLSPLTDDHIPPKCIFGTPRPNNLITVKSCLECNMTASKEDEYFKTVLSLRNINWNNPDAKAVTPSVFRALQKTNKKGFSKAFLENVFPVELKTNAGLYVGKSLGYNVDLTRLDKVVERIVRGLYFHETGNMLPRNAKVKSWNEDGLAYINIHSINEIKDEIVQPILNNDIHMIGKGTFIYQYAMASDKKWASAWILRFYENTSFLAITLPMIASMILERDNR